MNNLQNSLQMKKNCTFIIVCVTLLTTLALTSGKNRYGKAKTTDPTARIPAGTVPLMDYWMRDTWMTLAPDGYYYLTGTTADPTRQFPGRTHCWDWNDGIYVFRSRDMKSWESLGRVWSLDDDATVGHSIVGDRPEYEWAGDARISSIDVTVVPPTPDGINAISSDASFRLVYDAGGRCVGPTVPLRRGVYVVREGEKTSKIIVK